MDNIKKKLIYEENLSMSGDFVPFEIADRLLLLNRISLVIGSVTVFSSGNDTSITSSSAIVQNYEVAHKEKLLDSNPEYDK